MPNLVTLSKVTEYSFIQKTMCIGKQSDSHVSSYRRGKLVADEAVVR
jgi:hypothetical protein